MAFVAVLIRVAYVLSANTIGELSQELFYLRVESLKLPLLVGMAGLLIEILEFGYHSLVLSGLLEETPHLVLYLNAMQVTAFLIAGILLFRTVRLYTPRGIERRIEENMETIALLASARRRRRGGERSERGERDERERPRERRIRERIETE